MTIENIIQKSKAFNNAHTISKLGDTIQIQVAKSNNWKLLIIGVIAVLTPWILKLFLPADIELYNKIQWICYGLAALLVAVHFLQKNQKTEIDTKTKVITSKNKNFNPEEVVDFNIEVLKRRQLKMHTVYLLTKSNKKILIGSTTSSSDIEVMEEYAKSLLNYIKS